MRVILEYNPIDGQITDSMGGFVGNIIKLAHFGEAKDAVSVEDLSKLKTSGYSAQEIIQMKHANLI